MFRDEGVYVHVRHIGKKQRSRSSGKVQSTLFESYLNLYICIGSNLSVENTIRGESEAATYREGGSNLAVSRNNLSVDNRIFLWITFVTPAGCNTRVDVYATPLSRLDSSES